MDTSHFVSTVLDLGEKMLMCGAEIYRVEDTASRICKAYGARHSEVFALTHVIILTVQMDGEAPCTEMRRVHKHSTDLDYLNRLNAFSRDICRDMPDADGLGRMLAEIKPKRYPKFMQLVIFALISASFTLYSGGNAADTIVAAAAGTFMAAVSMLIAHIKINPIFRVFCLSIFCGVFAAATVKLGMGSSISKIIIGNIMILVPGLAITNSIRDMIDGDIIAGMIRLLESLFVAAALAVGFALALMPFGL